MNWLFVVPFHLSQTWEQITINSAHHMNLSQSFCGDNISLNFFQRTTHCVFLFIIMEWTELALASFWTKLFFPVSRWWSMMVDQIQLHFTAPPKITVASWVLDYETVFQSWMQKQLNIWKPKCKKYFSPPRILDLVVIEFGPCCQATGVGKSKWVMYVSSLQWKPPSLKGRKDLWWIAILHVHQAHLSTPKNHKHQFHAKIPYCTRLEQKDGNSDSCSKEKTVTVMFQLVSLGQRHRCPVGWRLLFRSLFIPGQNFRIHFDNQAPACETDGVFFISDVNFGMYITGTYESGSGCWGTGGILIAAQRGTLWGICSPHAACYFLADLSALISETCFRHNLSAHMGLKHSKLTTPYRDIAALMSLMFSQVQERCCITKSSLWPLPKFHFWSISQEELNLELLFKKFSSYVRVNV